MTVPDRTLMPDLAPVLIEAFEAVLGVTGADGETSFFAAGGTSLLAEVYARAASAATGRTITFTDIFQHPSPVALAQALTTRGDGGADAVRPAALPASDLHPVSENQAARLERSRLAAAAGQRAHWSHAELIVVGFDLDGQVDAAALDAAAHVVTSRHSALRTAFAGPVPDATGFTQRAIPDSYGIEHIDASHLHPAEVLELVREPFDLAGGQLARFLLASYADRRHQLWLAFEHIITDGVSGHVIVDELAAEYSRRVSGSAEPPPAPASDLQGFEFAALEAALCEDTQGLQAEIHWLRQIRDDPVWRPYRHPDIGGPGDDVNAGDVLLVRCLDAEAGRRLRTQAARYGTTLHALVVFALARAAADAAGDRDMTIYWYTANRSLPGVASTVDCLARATMARIPDVPRDRTEAAIRLVARTVAESMAYAFYPLERIARTRTRQWLMPEDEPFLVLHVNEDPETAGQRPPVSFAGLRTAPAAGYGWRDRRGFTIDASIRFASCELQVGLSYRDGMLPASAAGRLLDAFTDELTQIAEGAV